MKLLTKEEEAAHYRYVCQIFLTYLSRQVASLIFKIPPYHSLSVTSYTNVSSSATLQGGIIGGLGGLAVGAFGVIGAARRYPAFNQLTLPLKAFLITSAGTFSGIIAADHASRSYESSRNPADQAYASRTDEKRQAEISGMSWTQRAMMWGREERYKIVGASWLASMVAAFAIVGRNPYLSGQQKLVQARVYAQGLTLAVLIASAAFEMQDARDDKGRYETVEYVDEKDNKKHTKQVEREQPSDGDTLWKDMVKQEEERLKERDDAIKRMEERDRKKKAKEQKEHFKKSKKEEKPKEEKKDKKAEKEEKKDDRDDKGEKKDDSQEGGKQEEEEEEEDGYQPVPGKKGEGKMMRKVSDPPNPGYSAVP
jgi:outer membrane biosynthesis protein TonB